MGHSFQFLIGEQDAGRRVDEFFALRFGSLSRMRIASLIDSGACLVNRAAARAGYRFAAGDAVEVSFEEGPPTSMSPEPIPLEILYEDDHLLVIVKPAGMLVHPTLGVKSGTLANALSYHLNRSRIEEGGSRIEDGGSRIEDGESRVEDRELRIEDGGSRTASPASPSSEANNSQSSILDPPSSILDSPSSILDSPSSILDPQSSIFDSPVVRPGLVHRLDRATSGLMVVAKTPRALTVLSNHFRRRLVEKRYLALVHGRVEADGGSITAPIGRDPDQRPRWRVLENGRAAETQFRVLERMPSATLLELEPVTGRTNQLRIHCAHIGHPIVGDEMYRESRIANCESRIANCESESLTDSRFAIRNSQFPIPLCLHAWKLAFHHPASGQWLEFNSPAPSGISIVIESMRVA